MCGRFTQTKSRAEVLEELGAIEFPPLFHGRYNVAPAQDIAVIHQSSPELMKSCRWGFETPQTGALIINARIESLTERPMFKELITENRCLIPADGFFEWKDRQPYYVQLPDRRLFAFAGLWHAGRCVIITSPANHSMQDIHSRMPVILPVNRWDRWLKAPVLSRSGAPPLITRPVSRRVNKVAHDDPACLGPAEVQTDLSLFPDGD